MTLVIAQKYKNTISLSSDSRITLGNDYVDFGIKVFSVPVKIYSATNSENHQTELLFNKSFGLAVIGNFTNSYTVKESINEILQNLQLSIYSIISMENIAKTVLKIFKKITLDLSTILREKGICEIVLMGYCDENKTIRSFHFSCDISDYPIKPTYKEILKNDDILFFGSGKKRAEQYYEDKRAGSLEILKKVIQDEEIKCVGGSLQYGEFNQSSDFKVFGILDYEINDDNTKLTDIFSLRGINLYKEDFEHDSDFHVAYSFKMPFKKDRDIFFNDLIENNNFLND